MRRRVGSSRLATAVTSADASPELSATASSEVTSCISGFTTPPPPGLTFVPICLDGPHSTFYCQSIVFLEGIRHEHCQARARDHGADRHTGRKSASAGLSLI